MHGAGVVDEVHPRPRVSHEKFSRQHVSLEPIAARARGHEVAGRCRATVSERMHVVERRVLEIEERGAVHAAASAVSHGGALDGSLLGARVRLGAQPGGRDRAVEAGSRLRAGEGHAMQRPTVGQFHLTDKGEHPAWEEFPCGVFTMIVGGDGPEMDGP